LSFAVQMLDDDARLEEEGTLFEEDEFLLELEVEAIFELEDATSEDDEISFEDDNPSPKELLLIETTMLELEAPAELEYEDSPELELLALLYASRSREQENV